MILPTIQGAAPLEFLWHQIIGNLQTRYHVFPHSMTHISYNTDPLKYLFIYLPADRHLGWVRVELDKPWLEKKIIRDISHFWKISARWKNIFFWKYVFYHIYTLANQCHWSALWQILCVHRNHRRTFEKKNCVLSRLFPPTCTRHQFPRGHVQRELLFCKRTLPRICHLRNQWH